MILSFGLILIFGMCFAYIFKKIRLPAIVGMIFAGIVLGPSLLDIIDETTLLISKDIRTLALIIVLLKAGISLDIRDLKKVGRPAFFLSFVPASFEILAFAFFAPKVLGLNLTNSLLMGSVIAAVSPAIVVPRMVGLIEKGYGKKRPIPQMVLAGASCDDVFVLVLFTSFLSMAKGGGFSYRSLLKVPLQIILGIILGLLLGYILARLFYRLRLGHNNRLIVILGSSLILYMSEKILPISGLIGVIAMAIALKLKSDQIDTNKLKESFSSIWNFAEILLFVLVGIEVDISYMVNIGLRGLLLIALVLLVRSLGVVVSLIKTGLSKKEKIFVIVSYLPKATVQASIGSVALSQGLSSGNIILSMAVLSILLTAPLGAILIDRGYYRLLKLKNG